MKSILLKLVVILALISLLNATIFSATINASDSLSGYINKIGKGEGVDTTNDGGGTNAIRIVIGTIINLARIVGAAVAVCILLVIATKYILASAGDRADIKKYAINYVIGALIFFSASGILTIIKKFVIDATE